MWKAIKEYWEVALGFLIAIMGAIVLTGGKNRKTKDKLNNQNRKDNNAINEIHLERNKKIESVIEKHGITLEKLSRSNEKSKKEALEKSDDYERELKKKTNQELADLFNKE